MNLDQIVKQTSRFISRRAPEVLIGVGLSSMIASTVSAVMVTPEAKRRIDDYQSETSEEVTTLDKVRLTWSLYAVPVAYTVVGASVIISAQVLNNKRQSALLALLATTESTLSKYMNQIEEVLDPEQKEKIREGVAQKYIEESPVDNNRYISDNSESIVKFIDGLSGRTFYSDLQTVRSSVNDINEEISKFNFASQNSFYSGLGLDTVQLGDAYGWDLDNRLEVQYRTGVDSIGVPCYYIDYINRPKDNYYKVR